jgi:CrcB protein
MLGGIGAGARLGVVSAVSSLSGGSRPLGVLVVNVSGSLLLGLLVGLAVRGSLFVLAGAATLGSYTTFSTWMLQTQRLAEDGRRWAASANVLVSLLLGVAAIIVGRKIGAQLA